MTDTATASPRPWRSKPLELVGTNCLIDANGTYVATVANIDAALIMQAVNKHGMPIVELLKAYDALEAERDRLRDIVRRMLPLAEVAEKYADAEAETIKGICARKGVDSSVVDAIREKNANLLREARAAIGEGVEE